MTSIRQILARKPDVYSIGPEATVFDALRLMEQKNVGALLVMSGSRARRDLLRARLRAEGGPARPLLARHAACAR